MSLYNNIPQDSSDKKDYYTIGPNGEQAIEAIKYIVDSSKLFNQSSAYLYGNVLKYVIRMGRKGFLSRDIDKCIQYLVWLKEQESQDKSKPILENTDIAPEQLKFDFMKDKKEPSTPITHYPPVQVIVEHIDKSAMPNPLKIMY